LGGAGDGGGRWTLLDRPPRGTGGRRSAKDSAPQRGQALPVEEAVALVERVEASAKRPFEARSGTPSRRTVHGRIVGVALRQCPELPPTIAERIADYQAQNVADWVMYRQGASCRSGGARLGRPLVRGEESV